MSNPGEYEHQSIGGSLASHNTILENLDFQNRDSGATAPSAPSAPPAQRLPNQKVTLQVFRALLGIPQGDSDLVLRENRAATSPGTLGPCTRTQATVQLGTINGRQSRLSKLLGRQPLNTEYEASVYYTLVRKERMTMNLYHVYDILVYSCMIIQLIIASVLIILGATAGDNHVAVAVLGAITGVITGILSLIKGQGLPNRLLQYADGLRKVRDNVEFMERELRAGARDVTYDEVVKLRNDYEKARDDEVRNNPDTWTSFLKAPNTRETIGTENR